MSGIERFDIEWLSLNKLENGHWVIYDDHRAEVERLIAERDKIHAEVQRLTQILNGRRATAERVTAERDEAQAEVERLKEQVAALTVAVEQADEMKAHAEAAAAAEEAETDRVMSERDAAQAEVERLLANGQAIFDSSRPTDEDIWREAFMAAVRSRDFFRTKTANEVLAEYRKRWPR